MKVKTPNLDTQKVTITLPKAVLARLNELVPARQRSRFIAEALDRRLALEEQLLALDETAGAWSDENHPDMLDDAGIDGWLNTLRSSRVGPGCPGRHLRLPLAADNGQGKVRLPPLSRLPRSSRKRVGSVV